MFSYIDKLRKKPEPERRKAVLVISVAITLCIAIVWGIGLSYRISHKGFDTEADASTETLKETFSNFFDGVSKVFETKASDMPTTTLGEPAFRGE